MATLQPNTFRDPCLNETNTGKDVALASRQEAAAAGIADDLPWIVIWADGSHQGFECHATALWRRDGWRRLNHIGTDGRTTATVLPVDPNLIRKR